MSKSRSLKAASKQDPKSGPGSKLIHMGRGQIAISKDKYIPKGKAGRKQERAIAAGGAKNLMAGYEIRAKAKANTKKPWHKRNTVTDIAKTQAAARKKARKK